MKKLKREVIRILIVMMFIEVYFCYHITSIGETEQIDKFNEITAKNIFLAQTNTGKVLYQKDADNKIYPASTTKLLTALLVVENCDLNGKIIISEKAVRSVPSGYVNANLQVGEELTLKQVLHLMLISSANDAANALAEHVAGSIESFASMMNTKANELGCTNSNFTNPSGLHEEEHYTTAHDLFLIGREAIKDENIREGLSTTKYTLLNTEKYNGATRTFSTTNYLMNKNLSKYYYKYCIGAKTGYTGDAKNCIVAFAQKDGIELTAVIMGEDAKGKKFLDAKEMFEYIYENYEEKQLIKKGEIIENIDITNGTNKTRKINAIAKDDVKVLEEKNKNAESNKKIEYTKKVAPISKNETIGVVKVERDGIEYSTDIVAETNVEESKFGKYIIGLLIILLLIYIIQSTQKSNSIVKIKYKKNKYGGKY